MGTTAMIEFRYYNTKLLVLKKLLIVVFLVIFGMPVAYSQVILPPQPEPPTPPFQIPIGPPNQTFPSTDLFTKEPSPERWDSLAPMPTPRTEVAVAAIGERIYVIGGFDKTNRATAIVEVYDTITDTWDSAAPLPIPLHHVGAASLSGEVYVVGGYVEGWDATDSVFIYNQEADSWKEAASMPTKRGALTIQFVDGVLYAVGGADRIALDINEAYNPKTDTWQNMAPMPTARDHLASAVVDGKMYAIGGRIITLGSNLATNEVYDPKADSWQVQDSMPTARGGLAAAAIANTIFVFGGESPNFTFEQNEQYIPGAGWFSHKAMPTARHGLGVVTVDDRIYVIGGGVVPGASVSAINESYYNAAFIPEFGVLSFIVLGISFCIVFLLYYTRFNKNKELLIK